MRIKLLAGEVAKLYDVSKQTLIYYDKIGLFKPRQTDPQTRYRYYDLEQCEDLNVIICLKTLGLTLKEIKDYLGHKGAADRIRLLEQKEKLIQKRIEEIHTTKTRVESIIKALKDRVDLRPFQMGIRRQGKIHIVSEAVKPPFSYYDYAQAVKRLLGKTEGIHDTDIHELMVYVRSDSQDNEDIIDKVALPVRSATAETISAGQYGFIYHKGTFPKVKDTRKRLHDFVKASGFRIVGPVIEKVLLDRFAVPSEAEYLIEISMQVQK